MATFHVVPGDVPLILGMSFLGELRPKIDWKKFSVKVKGKYLKCV